MMAFEGMVCCLQQSTTGPRAFAVAKLDKAAPGRGSPTIVFRALRYDPATATRTPLTNRGASNP